MTPSKPDRELSKAEHLSLPFGDLKTLSRVIPPSGMFKSSDSKSKKSKGVQSTIKKKFTSH